MGSHIENKHFLQKPLYNSVNTEPFSSLFNLCHLEAEDLCVNSNFLFYQLCYKNPLQKPDNTGKDVAQLKRNYITVWNQK